ncbi:MAG: hypothetical protein EPO26_04050 [Chloroflexota bacterium]|nr:MAG: hypothetical protein EPO26_04050 [Chloroflexota bacterium]
MSRRLALGPIALYLAVSVAFLLLVPSFEAPDENSHYEYAILLARLGRAPQPGDRDPALVESVARLMLDRGHGLRVPGPTGDPIPAFNMELGRQPATFYFVPARLSQLVADSIDTQVRIMRLWSVALGLIVVLAAIVAGRFLARVDHIAGVVLPYVVATVPGFTFITGTINNDNLANAAAAIAFAGICIAIGTRAWRPWLLLVVGALVVGVAAKRTALTLVPGVLMAFLADVGMHGSRRRLAFAVLCLFVAAVLVHTVAVTEDDSRPISWRVAPTGTATRADDGLLGERAFLVRATTSIGRLTQVLAGDDVVRGGDRGLTAFAWMRASVPGESTVGGIELTQGGIATRSTAILDDRWRPIRIHFVPRGPDAVRVAIVAERGTLLADGIVVAADDRRGLPLASEPSVHAGTWDGRAFANLLANASAEVPRYGLHPELTRLVVALGVPVDALDAALSLSGWPSIDSPRTQFLVWFAFQSFIGRFGWLVLLLSDEVYQGCVILGAIAAAGVLWRLVTDPASRRWILVAGTIAGMTAVVAIGPFIIGLWGDEWPQGRYLYPALLPIAMLISLGLSAWIPRRRATAGPIVVVAIGIALQASAIFGTIVPHYRG